MSNFYENWLTDILTNREVCDEFGEKTILPILKSAQSIDLKHDIFSPSFFKISQKDFIKTLMEKLLLGIYCSVALLKFIMI